MASIDSLLSATGPAKPGPSRPDTDVAALVPKVPTMKSRNRRRTGARAAWMLLILSGFLLLATPAFAHQPVFLTAQDTDPARGPLLDNGKVSFAVYATLDRPDATRGLRANLAAGDPLVAELLIPALEPETSLTGDELPTLTVTMPDGTKRRIPSSLRERFDEPFSGTSYVRLASVRETAPTAGVYRYEVTGAAPARFTLAVGTDEVAGTVTGAEPPPAGGLAGWYATPPPTPPPTSSTSRASKPSTADARSAAGARRTNPSDENDDVSPLLIGAVAVAIGAVAIAFVYFRRRRTSAG